MNTMVIGGGFVGTVTAVVLAEGGHATCLIENDPHKRRALQQGTPSFEEPGLAEALQAQIARGTLRIPSTLAEAPCPDVAIVCVGTPANEEGAAELRHVIAAAQEAAAHMETGTIAIKSTVPPGTTARTVGPAIHAVNNAITVAALPEFLAEGSALASARRPERVVIGSDDADTSRLLTRLHGNLHSRILTTTPTTAEAIKYASNAMLATRVATVNELANVFDPLGVPVDQVMGVVGMDPRIGPLFLQAGLGFGGSCFPKDVSALRAVAAQHGVQTPILGAVLQSNDGQPLLAVRLLEEELGELRGKQVALLGLSFKPGTSDVRESRAVAVYRALRERGANVVAHDPVASEEFRALVPEAVIVQDPADAVAGADACVVATAWPEYRSLPWKQLTARMKRPLLIDGWRTLDPDSLDKGVRYRAIGQGLVRA